MRSIKFRVWDKKEKRMYGVCSLFFDFEKIIYAVDGYSEENLKDGSWRAKQINDFELMQYTGLKDKNGVGVFEGDIVAIGEPKVKKKANCEVVFKNGCFGIMAVWIDEKKYNKFVALNTYCNDIFKNCIEIIGNIYEDPELIGSKESV